VLGLGLGLGWLLAHQKCTNESAPHSDSHEMIRHINMHNNGKNGTFCFDLCQKMMRQKQDVPSSSFHEVQIRRKNLHSLVLKRSLLRAMFLPFFFSKGVRAAQKIYFQKVEQVAFKLSTKGENKWGMPIPYLHAVELGRLQLDAPLLGGEEPIKAAIPLIPGC
jgi:hypothetical protein